MIKSIVSALLIGFAGSCVAFPTKLITIIVPFSAGTNNDVNARDFANALGAVAKQPVVVMNRVGAEGTLGAQALLSAPADGHTLMFASNSLTVFDPLLKKNIPYDPQKDLVPLCGSGRTNLIIAVHGANPIKSVSDLVAAAKQEPGKLTYAYPATSMRLAGELFQYLTGVKLTDVPYKSTASAVTDVSSGVVDLIFVDRNSAGAMFEAGRMRPLAASGTQRMKTLPNVPSAAEAGVPGYSVQPWFGLYISSQTPANVQKQVLELVSKVVHGEEMKASQEKRGLEPFSLCGDALNKYRQEELDLWRTVVQKAGIVPQ